MADSSASYIHMVQHLIEKCLLFYMTKEECIEALSKHANIKPCGKNWKKRTKSSSKHTRGAERIGLPRRKQSK
uniref:Uncharacterized protein n=1 Tax=Nelumbo nucifera TaxID=4432 RepID=A0A822Y3P9_NELNU|nr:TPA_asm: hypothetical protein HUJ06_027397 [Nelumbo nucifera]